MTAMQKLARDEIKAEIKSLEAVEIAVETNEGTYGPHEACRKVGTSEPRFCVYTVYETVGGSRRVEGCDPDRAPGYARRLGADAMAAKRKRLAELRRSLRTA